MLIIVAIETVSIGSAYAAESAVLQQPANADKPRFTILASAALASEAIERNWEKGEGFAVLVRPTNISDQPQTIAPCGSGLWTTDNSSLYVTTDKACDYNTKITLAPGETFAGDLVLNIWFTGQGLPHTASQLPQSFRIGAYPAEIAVCNAIIHNSSGRCGDANTSWSNPIRLRP